IPTQASRPRIAAVMPRSATQRGYEHGPGCAGTSPVGAEPLKYFRGPSRGLCCVIRRPVIRGPAPGWPQMGRVGALIETALPRLRALWLPWRSTVRRPKRMTDAYEPREDEVVEDSQHELHPQGRPDGIVRAATDRNAPFSNHKHERRIKLFLPPRLAGLIVFT